MENGFIVFHVDGVHIFSSALPARELGWRQVIQAAMRPLLVVIASPVGDDSPGFEQVMEPADAQAFITQFSIEALDIAILRWLARLGVDQVDLAFKVPGQEVTARQLWPIVAANRLWKAAFSDDAIKHTRYTLARKARVHFHGQALACIGIDHVQHANRAAKSRCVMHEVKRPFLVGLGVIAQW